MEPRIQYAKTADGVSIAYYTLGEGVPLVVMPGIPSFQVQIVWEEPRVRRFYERLAEKRMVVRFDPRGSGLSDHEVAEYSLDAYVVDLEAVVNHLGLGKFALVAPTHSGPVAIAYAASHPERVSHLIPWCSWARSSDGRWPQLRGLGRLLNTNWELFTETFAHALLGWSDAELARRWGHMMRESMTQEAYVAAWQAIQEFDVTGLLPQVRSPTLVLHRSGVAVPGVDVARRLASGIPGARLTLLEGETRYMYLGDVEAVLRTIDDFLTEGEESPAPAELPEGMAVLLFADIAESTALTEQLGDSAFRAKARELDNSLRSVIKDSGGTPVEGKVLGDGVLAVFTSARGAIDCALRCDAASEPLGLRLHLGIHAGDVIREGNNVYGGAVNIAARIAAASEAGEVLVSDTVRSLGRTSAGVTFDDRGEHTLKGVGEPQHLFAVKGGG
jgi:class 3 adenylate cyclase